MTLTSTAFNVLVALADGELHGYAIMQEIDRLTDGAEAVGPTTLYRSIHQMLDAGLLEEIEPPDDSDERRRYYRITGAGRRAAIAEADRLERLARLARSKRGLRRRLA